MLEEELTVALEAVTLSHGDVKAELVPARGALISSLVVGTTEVFYLDRATLEDPAKNVRGGIPILFPFAGKLAGEKLLAAGTTVKQHGFGRNKPWTVRERRADHVRLVLVQDAETRAQFPYDGEVEYGVQLLPRGLQVELTIRNAGTASLPTAPGWHPYFRCTAARKAELTADVAGVTRERLGDDRELDFGVPAPVNGRARLQVPGLGSVALSFSPVMRHLQLWSLPGKDFVCLEPFLGPANAINTERRLDVPPGEARDLWMRIELV